MNEHLVALGLQAGQDYTAEQIKQAWRQRCNEHHPDKGGDTEQFRRVMHAYKMLTDPSYRIEQANALQGRKEDLNMRLRVPVTFEQAFLGGTIVVTFNRFEIGDDYQPVVSDKLDVVVIPLIIQPGIMMGQESFFSGKGHTRGEKVGDLIVQTLPREHPRFKVEGRDVVAEDIVDLAVMLKGGEIEIQTMFGIKTVKVPPGTQPGDRLEIPRHGVSKLGKHLVVVVPKFPDREALKTKEAWKGLDINWENHPENKQDEQFENMFINMGGLSFSYTTSTGT